jgi:ferrochelatase
MNPEMYVVSFHGIPIDYIKRGDPYMRQCAETAKEIARRFGWKKGEWKLVFQSRLGRQKWLTPYFDETIKSLPAAGVKSVFITQPGFTADCLETIDEIGNEGRHDFEGAGGEHLVHASCLNDDPEFIDALAGLVRREANGWA